MVPSPSTAVGIDYSETIDSESDLVNSEDDDFESQVVILVVSYNRQTKLAMRC